MNGRAIARRGRPGLLRTAARTAVVVGTATAVTRQAAPAIPPPGHGEDLISQLRELGQLREQGVLTEEEFATQKARLLNG